MKSIKSGLVADVAMASLVLANSALAGPPPNWPPNFPNVVKSKEDAVKYPNERVALVCKDCKSVTEKSSEDKKGIFSWFSSDDKHGCSGCSGKVTMKQVGGGKAPGIPEYTHTCSKCGDNSAYTCTTHMKH